VLRKDLERRSKKYAPMQNVSVVNWYMDEPEGPDPRRRCSPSISSNSAAETYVARS
jgi:hypothetical protein